MPSTPLIASSMGVATVSAITFGLAPGYCARTTIDGGTTSGYSAMGMLRIAIRPAMKISSEMTPAKIGRSMKNLDRFILVFVLAGSGLGENLGRRGLVTSLHDRRLWIDERPGTDPLPPVHHDALAGGQSRRHDAQAIGGAAERHFAISGFVVGADHHHEFLAL